MFAYLEWNPSPSVFPWKLPLLERPILWYGVFFALGFFLAYLAFVALLRKEKSSPVKNAARQITDSLSTYLLIGMLLGARLFDMLFYENPEVVLRDPLFLFRLWEGGLSSHGGVVGLILGALLYQARHRHFTTLHLLDLLSVVAGLTAGCIRLGNFFNQEILGTPSDLPWAVLLGHPSDGSLPVPRHPVQLYEALFYFSMFFLMWQLKGNLQRGVHGRLCGLFLTAIFSFRWLVELFKEEQSIWLHRCVQPSFCWTMGQWLSIPFILVGLWLLLRARNSSKGRRGN